MFMATLILVFSVALFFFYCQMTIQKIMRRAFAQAYFRTVAAAHGLEFPALRTTIEGTNGSMDYARLRKSISCDFLALSYLLKNAANIRQSYSRQERAVRFYFRLVLFSLSVRHCLRLSEKSAVVSLSNILQYFANVVGERLDSVRLDKISAFEYVTSR